MILNKLNTINTSSKKKKIIKSKKIDNVELKRKLVENSTISKSTPLVLFIYFSQRKEVDINSNINQILKK